MKTSGIKRIPKACGACRQSKVRCDGEKPCTRCSNLKKECKYDERPRDPTEDRFQRLEQEVFDFRAQLSILASRPPLPGSDGPLPHGNMSPQATHMVVNGPLSASPVAAQSVPAASVTSPLSSTSEQKTRKRKRSQLQLRQDAPLDFVSRGLLSETQARSFFNT